MKKIITLLFGCTLVLALANCGAPNGKVIVEKALRLAKIGEDGAGVKKITDYYDDKKQVAVEKQLDAACNAEDFKKGEANLDCRISAAEALVKAKGNAKAEIDAQAAYAKCKADAPKLTPDCQKVVDEIYASFKKL